MQKSCCWTPETLIRPQLSNVYEGLLSPSIWSKSCFHLHLYSRCHNSFLISLFFLHCNNIYPVTQHRDLISTISVLLCYSTNDLIFRTKYRSGNCQDYWILVLQSIWILLIIPYIWLHYLFCNKQLNYYYIKHGTIQQILC